MEETGILENLALLSLVLPDFEPSLKQCQITDRAAFGGPLTARELWLRRIWFLLPFCVYAAIRRRVSVAVGTLVLFARQIAWPERLRPCHW